MQRCRHRFRDYRAVRTLRKWMSEVVVQAARHCSTYPSNRSTDTQVTVFFDLAIAPYFITGTDLLGVKNYWRGNAPHWVWLRATFSVGGNIKLLLPVRVRGTMKLLNAARVCRFAGKNEPMLTYNSSFLPRCLLSKLLRWRCVDNVF